MTRRILMHTDEIVGPSMAGPGMRAWKMAEALADQHDVTLFTSAGATITSDTFHVVARGTTTLNEALAGVEIVIHQGGSVLREAPALLEADSPVIVIADLYGAWIFEQQEQRRVMARPGDPVQEAATLDQLREHIERADHLLCASSRQRALWIGHLVALGRVTHELYDADPALTDFISIVPFGLDDGIASTVEKRIKGIVPGIAATDKVILWGGGIHDWFDPLSLIRAVADLAKRRPEVRLLFLGTRHPNPNVPPMAMVEKARDLARSLDVLDRVVFFNDGWVPLSERGGFFADADVGASIHHTSLETEFSFRTRMLDFVWARLPIVATGGDVFSDIISDRGLGEVVGDGDVEAIATALECLLFDDEASTAARQALDAAAADFEWARVLRPLVQSVERAGVAPGRQSAARQAAATRTREADATAEALGAAAALQADSNAKAAEIDALRREVADLRASTSWRLTAPIRRAVSLLRRRR